MAIICTIRGQIIVHCLVDKQLAIMAIQSEYVTTKKHKEVTKMTYEFNCTGTARKDLVKVLSTITGEAAKYQGAPTFAYQVGYISVDKSGNLHMNDHADPDLVQALIDQLNERGFQHTAFSYDDPQPAPVMEEEPATEDFNRVIMNRSLFTDAALDNLQKLVDAKAHLIKKSLGVENLPIEVEEETVTFPWVRTDATPEEFNACVKLIAAMCEMARKQKRVTAKEKPAESDKYAFRCFLLRLGFIGDEYKLERKILLANLSGSSAFKSGSRKADQATTYEEAPAPEQE